MSQPLDRERIEAELSGAAAGWRVHCYAEVGSTMDVAREFVLAGAPAGTVVVADAQTAGRGRLGRGWISEPGTNLYLTVVLRPSLAQLRKLAMVAPLAVAEAIEELSGLYAGIKWPNDVQLGGLKCCGVLIDSEVQGETVAFALVGIGINVNSDPARYPELADIATSVAVAAGRQVSREALLVATLERLGALCEAVAAGEAVAWRWKARLTTLGRAVSVRSGATVEHGVAEDVSEAGALRLRRADGSIVWIPAGEVSLR